MRRDLADKRDVFSFYLAVTTCQVKTGKQPRSQVLSPTRRENRVPKCDVIENEICEIMGFVKMF